MTVISAKNAALARYKPIQVKVALIFLCLILVACSERRQQALIQKADEKIALGQYGEASDLLRKAITLNPESRSATKALYKLGFSLESYLRDFDGAIFNYQEFIRLSQDRVAIYEVQKRIANLYFEQYRDSEKAIAAYRKLISFNAESLEIDFFQFRIAQAFFRQNNFDQARLEYQNLLERYPKSQYVARTRYEIGNSYYMEGKYAIAVEALKRVLRLHTQSEYGIHAEFLVAQCLEQLDKLPAAMQEYESIRGRYPHPDVLDMRIKELKKRMAQKR